MTFQSPQSQQLPQLPPPLRMRYEPMRAKTVLNPVKAGSMPFQWSINPYRGCQHGCAFCYARSTHAFLGMEADDTFQHHILLKENAPEALEGQLRRLARSRGGLSRLGFVAIGTVTDPYQQIEAREQLTLRCLEVLAKYGVEISLTTRSPLILRDIALLRQMRVRSVNISVHTLDLRVWRGMEPATPSPVKRLETVQALVEADIPAGVFLAPILPLLTDSEEALAAVIGAAAKHKAAFLMPSLLRLASREVKVSYFRALQQLAPSLVRPYARLYSEGASPTAQYKETVIRRIRRLCEQYGLTAGLPEPQAASGQPGRGMAGAMRSSEPEQLLLPI